MVLEMFLPALGQSLSSKEDSVQNEEIDFEMKFLRDRLALYRDLLEVSLRLIMYPNPEKEKQNQNVDDFRKKLIEIGVVEKSPYSKM